MSAVNIAGIKAEPGERTFGTIETSKTVSKIPIEIPVTVVNGVEEGPTLLVSAAVHGAEIIGTLGLGKVLRDIDASELAGTLLAVPVTNTSAFEFGTRSTYWDKQDLNRDAETADPEGSPTEQLADAYLNTLVPEADALIDIHSGTSDSYVWYTIYPGEHGDPEVIEQSKEMAVAFGLEQVFRSTPSRWSGGLKDAAVDAGTPGITPEIGGGADFLHNGRDQIEACSRGIKNVMKMMGMLDGEIAHESDKVQICDANDDEIWAGTEAGMMLLECERGDYLEEGDAYASVYHPFTGEKTGEIEAPGDGLVLNTGLVWPVVDQGKWIGVLGEVAEEVDLDEFDLSWNPDVGGD